MSDSEQGLLLLLAIVALVCLLAAWLIGEAAYDSFIRPIVDQIFDQVRAIDATMAGGIERGATWTGAKP